MNTINSQATAQLAGVAQVFFIEHAQVLRWPTVTAGRLATAHQLPTGASFAQLVATTYTPGLDSEGSDGPHGTSYNQVLEGFYAGDNDEVGAQLAAMNGKRYLVLLRYYNGTIVAAGERLAGLLFTTKYSSGRKPGERKGHTWRFEAATSTPAAYVSKPFPVEGLGTVTPGQPLPHALTGAVVVRMNSGRVVAVANPGQTVILTSDFFVTARVE